MGSESAVRTEAGEKAEVRADLGGAIARLAAGDVDALDAIWRLAADELFGLALWRCGSREDAADAVQDVFVRLATLSPARLRRMKDPRAYLLTMARRAACDRIRRRRQHVPVEEALVEPSADDPERAAEARRLGRMLGKLPAPQREALFLRSILGCTFAEVARITRVPTFTAASRCRNGLEKLRRLLGRTST